MEWIYTGTKVSGYVILELALENRKKEGLIKSAFFTVSKTAGTGVPDCFHGRVGA
jgi:hypothetical protein